MEFEKHSAQNEEGWGVTLPPAGDKRDCASFADTSSVGALLYYLWMILCNDSLLSCITTVLYLLSVLFSYFAHNRFYRILSC